MKFPLCLLVVSAAFGQSFTASIRGVVEDTSGAVISGVRLSCTNTDTNASWSNVSNESGNYLLTPLPPGPYRLTAEQQGFKKFVREGIVLQVQQSPVIDIQLEVGQLTDAIEVSADAPLLEQSTSSVGQVIDNKKIVELPLNGRNPFSLAALAPGVQPQGGFFTARVFQEPTLQANFTVNGSASLTNEILLDGTSNIVAGHGQLALTPSVDSIQEFKVMTSTFSAEFGRTGGGVVNIVTKSGSNDLHGTVYEFLRNKVLDANNFFNNLNGIPRQPFVFNQYGTVIGGPVVLPKIYNGKNRTFFFFGYEGVKVRRAVNFVGTVPTELQKRGDFSQTRNSQGQLIGIYNPFSNRQEGGGFVRDIFPGNVIPPSLIDRVGASVATYYPSPNLPGAPFTAANNFIANSSQVNDLDIFQARLDHNFSEKNRLFARFFHDEQLDSPPNFFGNIATSRSFGPGIQPDFHGTVSDTHTFGPNTVLEVRYGFARNGFDRKPESADMDLTTIGFPASFNNGVQSRQFPEFGISGLSPVGAFNFSRFFLGADTHSLIAQVTHIRGRHTLKMGADIRSLRHNSFSGGVNSGIFNFNAAFTQGPNPLVSSSTAGNGFASLLLGTVAGGTATVRAAISYYTWYYAGYVQDDFRVSHKLTLNLGLRYDYETPRQERYDRISFFLPDVPNPVGPEVGMPNLLGGLGFPGTGGYGKGWADPDRNNFGPRFGFSYSVLPKTVLRGGYGITYLPNGTARNCCGQGQDGFTTTTSMLTSLDGVTPVNLLGNPFPDGLIQPPGNTQGLRTLLGQSIAAHMRFLRTSYSQQFNLNVQHELPGGILAEAGYVGSRGVKLPMAFNLNQLPDQYLSLGNQLLTQVPNPFFGIVTSGPNSSRTIAQGRLLRPYPQFDGVSFPNREAGSSTYHSFQARVERRFAAGLSVLGAYTFSKLISDISSDKDFAGDIAAPVQNSNNRRLERSLSPQDNPQRLVINAVYDLPIGRGKPLLGTAGPGLARLFTGWQIGGIFTLQSGLPLTLSTATNNTNSFGGGSRPNNNGQSAKLSSSERSLTQWFNTSVFSQPAPFTFGTTGRTLPDVREPGISNLDFSVAKNTRLNEKFSLQFRAEFFNISNTPRFAVPGRVFGTPQFGVISGQANSPRQIQFGLKLVY
jgi:hypothetical protein